MIFHIKSKACKATVDVHHHAIWSELFGEGLANGVDLSGPVRDGMLIRKVIGEYIVQ